MRDPKERPLLERTYDYHDCHGAVVMQSLRLRYPNGDKTFRQRRPDPAMPGEWINNVEGVVPVLYRLPQLIDIVQKSVDLRRIPVKQARREMIEMFAGLGRRRADHVARAGSNGHRRQQWKKLRLTPLFQLPERRIVPADGIDDRRGKSPLFHQPRADFGMADSHPFCLSL